MEGREGVCGSPYESVTKNVFGDEYLPEENKSFPDGNFLPILAEEIKYF